MNYVELADRLDTLQAMENQGRGVSAIRAVIGELRRGKIDSARAVFFNEHDKIRGYPNADQLLHDAFGHVVKNPTWQCKFD